MSIERKDNGDKVIKYDNGVRFAASMAYHISCTGIYLSDVPNGVNKPEAIYIEAINSRNQVASGYIRFPINQINELVEALIEIRNENQ